MNKINRNIQIIFKRLPPIVFVQIYNKKKAEIIVIGKPKENKLREGADLVTIPIITFNNVIPTTTGKHN